MRPRRRQALERGAIADEGAARARRVLSGRRCRASHCSRITSWLIPDLLGWRLVVALIAEFCDMSSPKGGHAFSVYDDLRARMVTSGAPEKEIAFAHDAASATKKAARFKSVPQGRVRVLLGSTAKMRWVPTC